MNGATRGRNAGETRKSTTKSVRKKTTKNSKKANTRRKSEARVARPTHPGEILKEDVLPSLDVSISQAARELGVSRQSLHLIMSGERPVTPEMAVRLGYWCGNGPDIWLRLQMQVDVFDATHKLTTAGTLKKIPSHAEVEYG